MDWAPLQQAIGYRFVEPALLVQALTHRSHSTPNNERLEFLGDSVLNCVVAAELFHRFGRLSEGKLTRLRASLVNQDALHRIAQELSLGDHLRLGEGELKSGGYTRPSILADALEALFGAIYLDGGFASAYEAIRKLYDDALREIDPEAAGMDAKTMLQEFLQARRVALPKYAVISTQGVAHNQVFQVECVIAALAIRTTGGGASRRMAEQEAARRAYEQIRR